MTRSVSTFNQLVNPDSIAALELELDADRARFDHLLTEYHRMREEVGSLHEHIERQADVLEALRGALPTDDLQAANGDSGGSAMTKREIATEVLRGSIEPLFPREVRRVAVERGWLDPSREAANQLSVAMAKAARALVLIRDDTGRYSLPEHQ